MTESKIVFGNPNECPSENCLGCESFEICRNKTLNRFSQNNSKDMKNIENEARQNSLGSLNFEENYSPS